MCSIAGKRTQTRVEGDLGTSPLRFIRALGSYLNVRAQDCLGRVVFLNATLAMDVESVGFGN